MEILTNLASMQRNAKTPVRSECRFETIVGAITQRVRKSSQYYQETCIQCEPFVQIRRSHKGSLHGVELGVPRIYRGGGGFSCFRYVVGEVHGETESAGTIGVPTILRGLIRTS